MPPGFEDQLLAQVAFPTGLAFAPDGRLLIATQTGQVFIYEEGGLHSTPAIDLGPRLCTNIERGLVGVAVGPDFADSHYIYLYYTYDRGTDTCGTDWQNPAATPVNRISRFVLGDDDIINPASETVLIDNIPSPTGNHIAGDLHFGKDGYLYATAGDGGCDYTLSSGCAHANNAPRYRHALVGKVLRVTSDGDVPSNNPYTGPGTTRCNVTGRATPGLSCQEIYALGLRNPFRFAFDESASTTRFFINDVGQNLWEEIDEGQAGADYGWNLREGHCAADSASNCGPPPAGLTNPIFDYDHSNGCTSITGGAFVPRGAWPAEYDGAYLYADFVCHKMFRLDGSASGGWTATEFASQLRGPVAMTFGPDGQLYYLSWEFGAALRRLAYTGGANRAPRAVATASPTSGSLPLDVNFDGTASSDPDGDDLTYEWDFGDGAPRETGETTTHNYETAGTYTATLEVVDQSGGIDVDSIRIDAGNVAPTPTIDTPAGGALFSVREEITLAGSASDPEDGPLPDSALTWQVVKHHATHAHPFLPPTNGNGIPIVAPPPEDFSSTTNSYLEIRLTATDSRGLSTTVTRDLPPALVDLAFDTQPAGLRIELNGNPAPPSLTSWEGWNLDLAAPDPQWDATDQGQTFVSWSDGGAQLHTIITPGSSTTYTARFTSRYARPNSATPFRVALVPAYRACSDPNRIHGPPLDQPSCRPPVQASDYTTVGTPDANGRPTRSIGYARLATVRGDPATPANEADVRIAVSITDVLDRLQSLQPYVGDLQAVVDVRLTDRYSGPSTADSATGGEFPLAAVLPCVVGDGTGGSSCAVATTMNALTPGSVVEGRRAIWQLGAVQVHDGGPDNDISTAGNGVLATQGVFVP